MTATENLRTACTQLAAQHPDNAMAVEMLREATHLIDHSTEPGHFRAADGIYSGAWRLVHGLRADREG